MSNSGNYSPNNEAKLIGEFYRDNIDKYIIVEDILVTGKTIEEAAKRLELNGKTLVGVYSLYIVDDFKNDELQNKEIKIYGTCKNDRELLIEFPWDKKLI